VGALRSVQINGNMHSPLNEAHQLALRAGVAVYISLGSFDGPMARKQLHVP